MFNRFKKKIIYKIKVGTQKKGCVIKTLFRDPLIVEDIKDPQIANHTFSQSTWPLSEYLFSFFVI